MEDFLRLKLGYGDKDISISNEVGILYDPDETDNLDKKLSELGMYILHPLIVLLVLY